MAIVERPWAVVNMFPGYGLHLCWGLSVVKAEAGIELLNDNLNRDINQVGVKNLLE